jgi:hypothetical protein
MGTASTTKQRCQPSFAAQCLVIAPRQIRKLYGEIRKASSLTTLDGSVSPCWRSFMDQGGGRIHAYLAVARPAGGRERNRGPASWWQAFHTLCRFLLRRQPCSDCVSPDTNSELRWNSDFNTIGQRTHLRHALLHRHHVDLALSGNSYRGATHTIGLGPIVCDLHMDRGTPRGAAPPTPPGIRVAYHGGSTELRFSVQRRVGAGRERRRHGCAVPFEPPDVLTFARTPSVNRQRPQQGTSGRLCGAVL